LAFIFLWISSTKVYIFQDRAITIVNKLTEDSSYKVLDTSNGKWENYSRINFLSIFNSVFNYLNFTIFIGSMVIIIIYTIKAMRNPSKKRGIK